MTPQRVAILRAVGSARSHPDVDAVYRAVSHHHLVCTRCRRIFDFEEKKFDHLAPPPSSVERFEVVRTTVHVEGICDACRRWGRV